MCQYTYATIKKGYLWKTIVNIKSGKLQSMQIQNAPPRGVKVPLKIRTILLET